MELTNIFKEGRSKTEPSKTCKGRQILKIDPLGFQRRGCNPKPSCRQIFGPPWWRRDHQNPGPLSGGQMMKSLDQLSSGQGLIFLDNFRGGEVLSVLDRLTGGEFINSLDLVDGVSILGALDKAKQAKLRHRPAPKRTLDTLTGMAFGESKRFDSLSGSTFGLSKRDFDEIDNVGFTGFAKRGWGPYGRGRGSTLALAKKNFDEIDRAGFETYNKRNFDEIDRAGFETFEKRDRKD
ncbi:uncharacterized protein CEXT_25401 [Caerostris extrusa]|uniref:Orcokinin n=1 Tax=Caerostris extrusa TaxID=172846 RepID=A0AAV4NWE8_CAEEX|nr:uncharacterized protein CEXT_25401 [Caerostris extrusa]